MLQNVPGLSAAHFISDNEKDIESRVKQKIGTASPASGKSGLVVLVLFPEITEVEKNLPGPPVLVSVQIQTIEQTTLNRGTNGTGLRSSSAAVECLRALSQHQTGNFQLYAAPSPVKPVQGIATGYSSHSVTLLARFEIEPAPKVLGVSPSLNGSDELVLVTATTGAAIRYTTDDSYPAPTNPDSYLYESPIAGLAIGTIVRSAAYKTDLNPSDVVRLTISA